MSVNTLETISPATNEVIVIRKEPSDKELNEIPTKALEAFKSFSKTLLSQRKQIVQKALELLIERQNVLARELTEQMGRPIAYATKEIETAAARGQYMLKVSEQSLSDIDGEPENGFQRYIKRVPLGPVLILFAWNYPYLILINSIIPAILAGNSVVLKPSPQTPTVAEQMQRLFIDAGLPQDVIQYFHCGSYARLEKIIKASEFHLICFTGSVKGGLAVQAAASNRVDVRVGLELGGKDPAYVRSDVDIRWAAEEIVDGAIFNSGQSCCSLERIYVDHKIHDEFVAAVQDVLRGYVLGDPFEKNTQIGPVVSRKAAEVIQAHIQDALQKGAMDSTPQNTSFQFLPPNGNFVAPVLLTNVSHNMKIMKEETFGPVIPIMRVKNDAEALCLMNDSIFGLTASIWTMNTEKGHELANEIEAGTVFVNRCDYPSPDLAWTGWKDSGKGHSLSKLGFEPFVKLKSYHIKEYRK